MGVILTEEVASSPLSMIAPFALYAVIIALFYFLIFHPQRKEQQRKARTISALAVGDSVRTTSGFVGVVIDISDEMVIVEFGSKNCRIAMYKDAIAEVEKPEDAIATNSSDDKKSKKDKK
ncbi:preprotein translocase subunit YajC [Butyrivibrio proteoclasticus]|uniref:preprotein translocase subunit YajC n=1 Tax=Butyrivibrio proteoclasticus TaxID=43305 RepID=UPI00068403E9|nr:preprotein translocase subunit YajC [Butyrivibrio proteoclasticus]